MSSGRPPRFNLQAILGIGLLAVVVGGMSWLVLSIGTAPKPKQPALAPTAIAAPTDIAQLPTPTSTPRPLPTQTTAELPKPAATVAPTRPAVEVAQIATLPPSSGPTPTPRVIKTLPTAVAATVAPSNTSGIAQVVEPVAPVAPVQSAQAFPTPAPLVEAPPPTSTPIPTFAPEVAQAQPTIAPRPTREAGGIPTFPPTASRGSNPATTSDSGVLSPNMPSTMPTVVVRLPGLPGAGDVAQSVFDPNGPAANGDTVVLPGITRNGNTGGFWPDGVPTPPDGMPTPPTGKANSKPNKPGSAKPTPTPRPSPNRPGQQTAPGANRPSLPAIRGNDNSKNDKNGKNQKNN